MKSLKFVLLGLALGSAASMAGDCVAPGTPQLVEGEDSTMEQMIASQKAVKEFQAASQDYRSCLQLQLDAAEAAVEEGTEGAAESLQEIHETYNASVSAEEEVAAKFNNEIRDYKTAHPG